MVDGKLRFDEQSDVVTKETSRTANFVLRTLGISEPTADLKLFESLVIPKLLYGSTAWRPSLKKSSERLKKVQRRFVRRVAGRCKRDPEELIKLVPTARK